MRRLAAACALLACVVRADWSSDGDDAARMPRGAELAVTTPSLQQLQPSLGCRALNTFNDILTLVTAAGLMDVTGRTVFAPSDAAWSADVVSRLQVSRARLLAADAALLAQVVNNHMTAAAGAAVSTRSVDVAGGTLRLRSAGRDGALITVTRQLRTRTEVRYTPSPYAGEAPVATTVEVQARRVHLYAWSALVSRRRLQHKVPVYVVNPGTSDADIVAPNLDCRWSLGPLHSAAVVHAIDSVLLSPPAAAFARAGACEVARVSVTVPRPPPAAALDVLLYYPISAARHPPVVFAHGMLAPVAVYAHTLEYVASHGFVVAAIRSGLGIRCPACGYQELDRFVQDVADTAAWLHAAGSPGANTPAVLTGRVHGTSGVGLFLHSLGGGAVFAAAARLRVRVGAIVALAPANGDYCTFPGGPGRGCAAEDNARALRAGTAISILCGERDAAIPLYDNARAVFAACKAPAMLSVLRRGTHCFTELPGSLGGSQCGAPVWAVDGPTGGWAVNLNASRVTRDTAYVASERGPQASLSQATQLAAARRHAAAFFSAHLARREDARSLVWDGREWLFTDALMRLVAAK